MLKRKQKIIRFVLSGVIYLIVTSSLLWLLDGTMSNDTHSLITIGFIIPTIIYWAILMEQ